jgi:RNA polymerase sigma-70 factor (ECF subfamily)
MRTSPDASFDEFFRLRYRDLVRYIGRLGATVHDAEEAAQDAMTAAYERWHRIDNPDAWVWRVACRAYLRTHRRRRLREVLQPGERLTSSTVSDESEALASAFQVRGLLLLLAAQQRRVMAWWLDGYRFDEIAAKLDVRTATARSLFRHARARLRDLFRAQSGHEYARRLDRANRRPR